MDPATVAILLLIFLVLLLLFWLNMEIRHGEIQRKNFVAIDESYEKVNECLHKEITALYAHVEALQAYNNALLNQMEVMKDYNEFLQEKSNGSEDDEMRPCIEQYNH
jgi:hypothetical protein